LRPPRQSDRSFGLTFAAVFAALFALGWLWQGAIWVWSALLAAGFLASGLLRPSLLRPLNAVWRWLVGHVARVNSLLVLGLLFYAVITPVGFLLRRLSGDPMARRLREPVESYLTPVRRQLTLETLADQF
jgi:ABC-type uncharacterized transport system permease subunit